MFDKLSLRLCTRHQFLYHISKRSIVSSPTLYKRVTNYKKLVCNEEQKLPTGEELTREEELFNSLRDKLVYNSVVTKKNSSLRWRIRSEESRLEAAKLIMKPPPLSLRWIYDEKGTQCDEAERLEEDNNEENEKDENVGAKFPYSIVKEVEIQSDTSPPLENGIAKTKYEPDTGKIKILSND